MKNNSIAAEISMPFWCVGNPLGDPFGGPVLEKISSLETAGLIADAAKKGLITTTSWHDDDLVPWDPEHPEDDLDPKSEAARTLRKLKKCLDAAGLKYNASICNLHGNKLFRDGGLANPDPEIRAMAVKKVQRTLRIGQFFGARHYTYWVARDGFESTVSTDWKHVYDWIAEGLNGVTDYIEKQKMTNYIGATVEPKPNEPRGQMFLPTSGHAAGFIFGRLDKPDFWGVNPELLQHESMCLLNAVMTVSYLISLHKLKFIHFGSQIKGQFDNDFPPLAGPEGLSETVYMFKALKDIGWKGIVEFDCHMLRAEADVKNQIACREQFIENCVEALHMAEALAQRIRPASRSKGQTAADLAAIRQMCNL